MIKTNTLEVYEYTNHDGSADGRVVYFFCPGCKARHTFNIERPDGKHPCWTWDGNVEKPTFAPSLLVRSTRPVMDPATGLVTERNEEYTMCHLFLKAGVIEFLADCSHGLAGQKVPLPSIKDH